MCRRVAHSFRTGADDPGVQFDYDESQACSRTANGSGGRRFTCRRGSYHRNPAHLAWRPGPADVAPAASGTDISIMESAQSTSGATCAGRPESQVSCKAIFLASYVQSRADLWPQRLTDIGALNTRYAGTSPCGQSIRTACLRPYQANG
ncbi:hypothetical protein Cci01nite_52680 [Catellatospora citrea]|uniref:Uncharacterized protein n=1 Tax=Catellatospora citrea TaxID=53366 RepID=A0A8J3KQI2_9ACTN|nr:hypothetical protein Cci01nite_52680 [Catellatospora citrea]